MLKKLTIKLPYSKKGLRFETLWHYRKKDYDPWSYRVNITNGEVLMYETRNGQVERFYTTFKAKKLSHAEKNNHC